MTARTALLGGLLGVLAAGAVRAAAPIQDERRGAAEDHRHGRPTANASPCRPTPRSRCGSTTSRSRRRRPGASPRRPFPAAGKQVPIPFELPYSAADIVAGRRYVVRAKIVADGKTLFSTKTPYPVITRGAPTQLEILVQQAGRRPGGPAETRDDGRRTHGRRLEARRARDHARRRRPAGPAGASHVRFREEEHCRLDGLQSVRRLASRWRTAP